MNSQKDTSTDINKISILRNKQVNNLYEVFIKIRLFAYLYLFSKMKLLVLKFFLQEITRKWNYIEWLLFINLYTWKNECYDFFFKFLPFHKYSFNE